MSRPFKCRRVAYMPEVTYFKPAGVPLRALDEVHLSVEEAEAIRLKDLEGLEQEQCAVRMSVSRPTYQRILKAARVKVADALLTGKAIRIEGGNYEIAKHRFHCGYGHEWEVAPEAKKVIEPQFCPICNTPSARPQIHGGGQGRPGRHRRKWTGR